MQRSGLDPKSLLSPDRVPAPIFKTQGFFLHSLFLSDTLIFSVMAPPFVFPSNLKELEEDLEEDSLRVLCPVHVSGLRPSQVEDLVKGVTFDLSDCELFCIEEQDVFDRIYSLVKEFSTLTPSLKLNLVETLRSNLSMLFPSIDSLSRAAVLW